MSITITHQPWGQQNKDIRLFRFTNSSGSYVELTNYGATLVSVMVPDAHGNLGHVVAGFTDAEAYMDDNCYIGSTIGRYANRISNARFNLNGETYVLQANDGPNCNHGAASGYNYKVFGFEITDDKSVVFTLHSQDGDGGFPGNLNLRIFYEWTDDNELRITYHAVSDKDTIANFTNHAYLNLSGTDETVFDHSLIINSDKVVEADDAYIPTGRIIATPAFENNVLHDKTDINTYYILDKEKTQQHGFAARLVHKASGRTLEVATSYPGIFLYTGDYLSSSHAGHNGKPYQPFGSLCLECQHYPDSINHPEFPQAVLKAHTLYNEYIHFKFGTL